VTDIGVLEDLLSDRTASGRIQGVVVGIVTNNQDPKGMGRVKLKFPWLSEDYESNWARIAALMAGKERAAYFLPEVDDEVLVAFEHGAIERPMVLGALWNGKDKPPVDNTNGKNDISLVQSRTGLTVKLDDTEGAAKVTISDKEGKNLIEIDAARSTITVSSDKDLILKAKGKISLEGGGEVSIKGSSLALEGDQSFALKSGANGSGKVEATGGLAITCMAGVNVNNGALEVK
jgi:uncharacterized protein involved in type VI secretion and phage assembly